jgi:hypothetical protein
MLAILAHALNDFQLNGRDGRRARRLSVEANAWFASGDDAWPFSFLAVCETLGLDASYLRSALRRFGHVDACAAPSPTPHWGAVPGANRPKPKERERSVEPVSSPRGATR